MNDTWGICVGLYTTKQLITGYPSRMEAKPEVWHKQEVDRKRSRNEWLEHVTNFFYTKHSEHQKEFLALHLLYKVTNNTIV